MFLIFRAGTGVCPYKKDVATQKASKKSMKSFITLYRKELKSISGLVLIMVALVLIQIALDYLVHFSPKKYQFYSIFIEDHNISYFLRYRFYYSMTEILAVIFAYLIIIEQKTKTHFQLRSLPVRSSKIIYAKFFAVVSVGLIISIFHHFIRSDMMFDLCMWMRGECITTVSPKSITTVSVDFKYILSTLFFKPHWRSELNGLLRLMLLCSFIVISRAVMFAVSLYRTGIGILTFIGVFSLYMYLGRIIYKGFFISQSINFLTVCTIIVLMEVGIILTEKFAEI